MFSSPQSNQNMPPPYAGPQPYAMLPPSAGPYAAAGPQPYAMPAGYRGPQQYGVQQLYSPQPGILNSDENLEPTLFLCQFYAVVDLCY